MNVIKNKRIKNGYMVWQDVLHGPAVATGTTVTSANSLFGAVNVTADGVPPPKKLTLP